MMLDARADGIDVGAAIAHFRAHGWARLGPVASEAWLERLRTRADDLMFGRVVHEGPIAAIARAPERLGEHLGL